MLFYVLCFCIICKKILVLFMINKKEFVYMYMYFIFIRVGVSVCI